MTENPALIEAMARAIASRAGFDWTGREVELVTTAYAEAALTAYRTFTQDDHK